MNMNTNLQMNVGGTERALRVVVGVLMLSLAIVAGHTWMYIGVIPLMTGVMGFCPAYKMFGINTCKPKA